MMQASVIRSLDGTVRFNRFTLRQGHPGVEWNTFMARLMFTDEMKTWMAENEIEAEVDNRRWFIHHGWDGEIELVIRDEAKAMLFKITWG